MNNTRRHTFKLLAMALAASSLSLPVLANGGHDDDDDDGFRAGKVFTSSNAAAGNEVLVFSPDASGALSLTARLATAGYGTGAGLGSQGAVTLSQSGRYLFVVNALSNTVSTFAVRRHGLVLRSTVDSGGQQPISVTEHKGVVYVVNASGANNVSGFRNLGGQLHPLPRSTRPLSVASGAGPAQVSFSPDGDVLVVTEKATNRLTTYRVGPGGWLGSPQVTPSVGQTPFGFAFERRGHLLVSEAFGGAVGASAVSSYAFEHWGSTKPVVVSPSVATTQTAACWVVTTPNGRYAYATNTGSASVSSYTIDGRSGKIKLAQAVAGTSGAGPIDAAVPSDGDHLYVLNAGSHSLSAYSIADDGTLKGIGGAEGLPAGAAGLAAN